MTADVWNLRLSAGHITVFSYAVCALLACIAIATTTETQAADQDAADRVWICHLDLAAHKSKRVLEVSDQRFIDSMAYSPVTNSLALALPLPHTAPAEPAQVFIRASSLDGGPPFTVGAGRLPTFSPRGQRIAVTRESAEAGVWIVQADGSHETLLDSAGRSVAWSRNGSQLAFIRKKWTANGITVFNLIEDMYTSIRLSSSVLNGVQCRKLFWSPNGQRIGILCDSDEAMSTIASVSVEPISELVVHLQSKRRIADVCWLSDSQFVFSAPTPTDNNEQLHVLAIDPAKPASVSLVTEQATDRRNKCVCASTVHHCLYYASEPPR